MTQQESLVISAKESRRLVGVISIAWLALVAAPSMASEHGASSHAAPSHGEEAEDSEEEEGHGEEAEGGHGEGEKKPINTSVFDLGEFTIETIGLRHNDGSVIRFKLALKLSEGTSEATVLRLENWRRRYRDQAITAVRSVEEADLADPKLVRVQRLILTRIKRLPFTDLIQAAYLTEFEVGDE